jgi:hypothetical protein
MRPIDHNDIASRSTALLRQNPAEPRVDSRDSRCENSGRGHSCDRAEDDDENEGAHRSVARSVMSELRDRLQLGDADEDDGDIALTTARIASALRVAVSAAETPGDPIPGSLDAIEAGLANAERSLALRGFSTREIELALGNFREELADQIDALADQEVAPSRFGALAITADYQRRESASLEIRTREGDLVEIQIRNRSELALAGTQVEGAGFDATRLSYSRENRLDLELEIEGELSAEEAAAVQDLVARTESLANRFYSNGVDQSFDLGAALDYDGSLLAGFRLDLAVEERYSLTRVMTPRANPEPAPDSPVPALPAQTPANASQPAATNTVAGTPIHAAAPTPSAPAPAATPIGSEAPAAAPLDPVEAISNSIRDFLSHLIDATAPDSANSSLRLSQRERIDFTLEAIGLGQPAAPSVGAGFEFLQRILDGFAGAPAPEPAPANDPAAASAAA